jgi:hypothetical protein
MNSILLTICLFLTAVPVVRQDDPRSQILTYKQYAKLQHDVPYVLEFQVGEGALLIFGARHVFDPADPQIADIEREWARFNPTVAFNEGGNPPTLDSQPAAVERFGEPGLVRFLAGKQRVPIATFEPRDADEREALLKKYSDEQVAVFDMLRSYLTFRNSKQDITADQFVANRLSRDRELVAGTPPDLQAFQAACDRLFVGLKDWREVPEDWFDPTQEGQFTNEMQNDSGHFRDLHIYDVLTRRVRHGDRVFAVIGVSHVPALEPALVANFGPPTRKRDGAKMSSR